MTFLNHSPRTTLVVSILVVIACGLIWWRSLTDVAGPHYKWGYDLGSGELYRVAITSVPPYAAPTGLKNGVDALGVRDIDGVQTATALRSYSPDAAVLVRRMVDPEGVLDDPRTMMDTIHRGTLIRRLADTEWATEMSPTGMAIVHEISPASTSEKP